MALDFGSITAEKRNKTIVDELTMELAQFLRMEDFVAEGTGLGIGSEGGSRSALDFKNRKGEHIRITVERIPMRDCTL